MGSILGFIVALVPLIALHEMGHMFIAKWVGVWVREFGIGLPPRIAKLFKWQETDFTLNAIPLGGFARMEGEEDMLMDESQAEEPESTTPEERAQKAEAKRHSLYAQSPRKRILIFLGGPLMNLLTGLVLSIVLFVTGIPIIDSMTVNITNVLPNTPAEEAGLRAEDVIVAMNGEPVDDVEEVIQMTEDNLGEEVTLTIKRSDEETQISLVPREDPPPNEGAMGIALMGEPLDYHIEPLPLWQSLTRGTAYFFNLLRTTLWAPVLIIRGLIPAEAARPVGIVNISRMAYQSIQQSVTTGTLIPILNLLIIINISLAVFNLLPLPALDGGRVLFTTIEMIRNKPLSPKLQERVHQVALAILVILFIVITVLDIVYPVNIPSALP
jgi:regulator of sigma E protease